MKKYLLFFILLFLYEFAFVLSSFTSIIDGNRTITEEEEKCINKILEKYHINLTKLDFDTLKNEFYNQTVKISIEYNNTYSKYDLTNEYMGEIRNSKSFEKIFHSFNNFAGDMKTLYIESVIFSKQPYDYPIGNIYYLVLKKEYKNLSTKEIFFISKDTGKIYEHIIILPK